MRGYSIDLAVPLLLLPFSGSASAQVYYTPISVNVDISPRAIPEAEYEFEDGRLKVELASGGVSLAKDGAGRRLPYLHVRLEVENEADGVASLAPEEQRVVAEEWGELRPAVATTSKGPVQGPVRIPSGKRAKIDLRYSLAENTDPARVGEFTVTWRVRLESREYAGDTLFRQIDATDAYFRTLRFYNPLFFGHSPFFRGFHHARGLHGFRDFHGFHRHGFWHRY